MFRQVLDLVRGLVRPVVTLVLVVSVTLMVFGRISVPEWYVTLVGTAVGFWFASRSGGSGNPAPPSS